MVFMEPGIFKENVGGIKKVGYKLMMEKVIDFYG